MKRHLFKLFNGAVILFFLLQAGKVSADELLSNYLKQHYPGIKPEWVYMQEAETFDWIKGPAGEFTRVLPLKGASDGWAIEVENKVEGKFLQWGENLLDRTMLISPIPYQYLARIKIPEIKNPQAAIFKIDGWEISARGIPEDKWVLVPIPHPSYFYTLKNPAGDKFYLDSYYFVPLINDIFVSDEEREKFFKEWAKVKKWEEEVAGMTGGWNPDSVPRPTTFIYGVWTGGKGDMFRLRVDSSLKAGMNLIMVPGGIWNWKKDYEDRLTYLSRFGEKEPYLMAGIQGVLQSKLWGEKEKWKLDFPYSPDAFKILVAGKIKAGVDIPRLLGGWYLFDEPRMQDVRHIRIAQSLLYTIDPYHPIQVVLNAKATIWALGPYLPILITDYYNDSFEGLKTRLEYALYKSSTKDVWWMASGHSPWGYFPSPEDVWLYNHLAISLGVKGIVYHLYNYLPYWLPTGNWNRSAYRYTLMDTFNYPTPTWKAIAEMGVYFNSLGELLYRTEAIKKTIQVSDENIGYGWLKATDSPAEYLVVYNKNRGQIVTAEFDLLSSGEIYDLYPLIDSLLKGKEEIQPLGNPFTLSLGPGKGKILVVCSRAKMRKEILPSLYKGLYQRQKNIFVVKYNPASAQGLDTGGAKNKEEQAAQWAGNGDWAQAFATVQEAVSEIDALLQAVPQVKEIGEKMDNLRALLHASGRALKKYDYKKIQKPPLKPLAEQLLSLRERYYQVLFSYRNGDSSKTLLRELNRLLEESRELRERILKGEKQEKEL